MCAHRDPAVQTSEFGLDCSTDRSDPEANLCSLTAKISLTLLRKGMGLK
jgi:hypothetical protein